MLAELQSLGRQPPDVSGFIKPKGFPETDAQIPLSKVSSGWMKKAIDPLGAFHAYKTYDRVRATDGTHWDAISNALEQPFADVPVKIQGITLGITCSGAALSPFLNLLEDVKEAGGDPFTSEVHVVLKSSPRRHRDYRWEVFDFQLITPI